MPHRRWRHRWEQHIGARTGQRQAERGVREITGRRVVEVRNHRRGTVGTGRRGKQTIDEQIERVVPRDRRERARAFRSRAHERREDAVGPIHTARVVLDLLADVTVGERVARSGIDRRDSTVDDGDLEGAGIGTIERARRSGHTTSVAEVASGDKPVVGTGPPGRDRRWSRRVLKCFRDGFTADDEWMRTSEVAPPGRWRWLVDRESRRRHRLRTVEGASISTRSPADPGNCCVTLVRSRPRGHLHNVTAPNVTAHDVIAAGLPSTRDQLEARSALRHSMRSPPDACSARSRTARR